MSSAQVRPVWTNTASKLGVPDLENLFSVELNEYYCPETGKGTRDAEDLLDWMGRCSTDAEHYTAHQSIMDNQPRVVNVKSDSGEEYMLRVGDWSGLAQP